MLVLRKEVYFFLFPITINTKNHSAEPQTFIVKKTGVTTLSRAVWGKKKKHHV